MATTELVFKIRTDSADFKSTMAQVRSELTKTGQTQSSVAKGELSMRQQLAAAASLQRQRSAALIAEWRKTETAAKSLARGVQPVSTNIQKITDVMQTLARSTATIQGPLGGVAGRLSSVGAIAGEAAGSLGVFGVAAGAAVVGVVALTAAIVKATVATAEWQGKLFDLSQQVGISVELLSALEIGAATTGGSIEGITQSIFIFQQKLEDAQDPASKTAKIFKDLGVATDNTEQALRDAFTALARMPEGFKQSDTAAQLFGSRGGKQVLGVLKEWKGDVQGAMEEFRRMGILLSGPAAQAADKFNDSLAILGFQIRGLVGLIGNEAMPQIGAAIETLSKLIVDNQDVISAWADIVGDAARGSLILADSLAIIVGELTRIGSLPIPKVLLLLATVGVASPIGLGLANLVGPFAGVTGGAGPVVKGGRRTGTGTGRGGGGRGGRDTALRDATKEALLTEKESLLITAADINENKRAFDEGVRTIEDFTRRAIELNQEQLDATINRISAESNALEEALAKRLIKADEYEFKQRELDLEAAKANQENKEDEFKLEQERDKKISEARIAAKKRELQIAEEADQRTIKRIEQRVDEGVLLESKGEELIGAIIDAGLERKRKALSEEEDAYSTSLERRKDINAEIIRLDAERADSAEETARRVAQARFDEQNAGAAGATRNRRFAIDRPEITGGVDQLFEAIDTELTGTKQAAALAGLQALTLGFDQLGQAVGQAVHSFVLYGNIGTSIRKVTAEVLASVAQMAATKAIFELAEGFAVLALAFFGIPNAGPSAAAHFKAAALYGIVAGIAAGAGRAIAGNSFANQSGGTTTGQRTGGPEERRPDILPRDINRNAPPINVQVVVRGEATEGFRYVVEKAATDSVRSNGVFRKIQNGEAV